MSDLDPAETPRTLDVAAEFELSAARRRLSLRLLTYNAIVDHPSYGALMFEPGAFGAVDPAAVRLRMDHADPPTGLGTVFDDRADGPYMDFRVAPTARGDEQLVLARDGVSAGASVGYSELPGRTETRRIDGRSVTVYPPGSVRLTEVSTTWRPTFATAGVTAVSLSTTQGDPIVTDIAQPAAPAPTAEEIAAAIAPALEAAGNRSGEAVTRALEAFTERFESLEETNRRALAIVPAAETARRPQLASWVEVAVRRMRGEVVSATELHALALDDVVTTTQPGLVPGVFTADYQDLIRADRPFLASTRQISPPASGTTMTLPIITRRAVAGTQANGAEKGALSTTATRVGTGSFAYQSVFGGADISIQFINRAERGFYELLTGDMAQAYALDCDAKALAALIAGYTDSASVAHVPVAGGVLDPENLAIGAAWQTSIATFGRAPDTIWMNSAAVAAFIDAKEPMTNGPLYSNLAAAFTTAAGPGGTLSGLRPVYVPALDSAAVDVIIGPSAGFVWAEDGAVQLTADVPEKAGRDLALAGGIFPAPRYAHAFTTFTLAS